MNEKKDRWQRKPHKYAPSPSEVLRSKGIVVENSYFFVQNGELVLKDGRKVSCDFEVGYMQDASAWAVVYITYPEDIPQADRHDLPSSWLSRGQELIGIENVWGRTVKVSLIHWISATGSGIMEEDGIRAIFMVSRYEIGYQTSPISAYRIFSLVNLPVHFSYSPQFSTQFDLRDAENKAYTAGVNAAIAATLEPALGKSRDKMHTYALEQAELARKTALEGLLRRKYVPIKVNGAELAQFFWQKKPEDIGYPLEPMCVLSIDTAQIPKNWEVESIVDWICALASMALGRDIQWIHLIEPSGERGLPPPYEVWEVRNIQSRSFLGFAENPRGAQLTLRHGLHEKSEGTLNFVVSVLGKLMQRDMDQIEPYLNALRYYISCAAVHSLSYEFECTLLSVLGEYVYKVWTEVEGKKYTLPPDQRKARKSIIATAKAAFSVFPLAEINPFVPAKPGEPTSEHDTRRRRFIEAILNRFYKSVGYSQIDQLAWFFESHGYQADHYRLARRIEAFVESRNALVHEHCFHNERKGKPEEIYKEIRNIRMMIPLMFAATLRYEGRYWDSYCDTWATTPIQS